MKRTAAITVAAVLAVTVLAVPAAPTAADMDLAGAWQSVVPGEYVVALKGDGDPAAVAASLGSPALQPMAPGSDVYRVLLDPTADPEATVAILLNTPGVDLAQPNVWLASTDFLGLRKRFFSDLTVGQVSDGDTGRQIDQPGLANAGLPAGATAHGVTVAVLDTGIDAAHPAFVGRVLPGGYDFVDGDEVPAEVANGIDDNGDGVVDEAFGHGTYVAGLVALVAPEAHILPIRVLDSDGRGSTWTMMQGLALAAARGARVVNLSLGGAASGPVAQRQLITLESAGVIVVAAGGNDASDAQVYPAASDGVVGVTSIDAATGRAATFANHGSWLDVAAPGVGITSAYPGGRSAVWGGSSASAPVVSGVVAIVAAQMPGAASDDVVSAVTSTARSDGLSGLSSYGRIDAAAAVIDARN